MSNLARILFSIARSRFGSYIIGWSFAHMNFLIPVDKLYETAQIMAFHHPKPSHPVHVLIVPKRQIRSLLDLTEADGPILNEVIAAAQHVIQILNLEEAGFRLIVNGGAYQDVRQIHWHLISETAI